MDLKTAVYVKAIEPDRLSVVQEQTMDPKTPIQVTGIESEPLESRQQAANLTTAVHLKAVECEPASVQVAQLAERADSAECPPPVAELSLAGLCAATVVDWDGQGNVVTLRSADVEWAATLHPSVDPVVIRRAAARGELTIVQRVSDSWQVIGVLRTSATPGLDPGDDYLIEARRVTLRAEHELVLTSGAARFALAAFGRIECIARHITSRASAVHKIIGRVIQLN